MSANATIRTRKSSSRVVHTAEQNGTYAGARLFETTVCGRTIEYGRDWVEVAEDDSSLPECQACGRKLGTVTGPSIAQRRRKASISAAQEEAGAREMNDYLRTSELAAQEAGAARPSTPLLEKSRTREWVQDRDTYTLLVNGHALGVVDSTRDRTGDRIARRVVGEIVAPRFVGTVEAEAYLIGAADEPRTYSGVLRPTLCADNGAHGHGACIRPVGHYDVHVSSSGHRWSDADTDAIVAHRVALLRDADHGIAIREYGRYLATRWDAVDRHFTAAASGLDALADAIREEQHAEAIDDHFRRVQAEVNEDPRSVTVAEWRALSSGGDAWEDHPVETDSPVRRVPSSVGDPVARPVVAGELLAATEGATVLPSGSLYGGSGIVVALPRDDHGTILTRNIDVSLWTRENPARVVSDWVDTVAPFVSARSVRPRAFGAWINGDTLYLDVVEIFPDDEEAAALAAGRARNQIAVWHAGRREEIPTGGTGEVSAPRDTLDLIMAYEDGSIGATDALDLFGRLIADGRAWTLQGSYGRTARDLISRGLITESGDVTEEGRGLAAYAEEDDTDEDDPAYI